MTPMREESVETGGKVRKIEVSRSQGGRISSRMAGSGTATVDLEPDAETDVEEPEVAEEVEEEAEVAAETRVIEAPAEEGEAEAAEEATEETESAAVEADEKAEPAKTEAKAKPAEEKKAKAEAEAPAAHRQEDYIAPAGGAGHSIRDMEMKPRANVTDRQRKSRPDKDKEKKKPAKPSMPFIASAPEMSTPKPKKPKPVEEPAAQKPDFKLTGDMLKGDAPLRRQYERHIEERGREEKEPGKGGRTDLKRRRDRERELEESRDRGKPQQKRRRRGNVQEDAMQQAPGKGIRRRKKSRKGPVVHKTEAEVDLPITIRSLSEAMGRPAKDLMTILFVNNGVRANINDQITEETALELALELGVDLIIKHGRNIEEELAARLEHEDNPEDLGPGRRSSRFWATSITARRRCSIRSAKPTWRAEKRAASRSTSPPIRWSTTAKS